MPVSKYAKKQPSRREYYYEDEEEPLPSPRFPKLKPREHEDDDTVLGTPRRIGEQLEVRARLPAAAAAAAALSAQFGRPRWLHVQGQPVL